MISAPGQSYSGAAVDAAWEILRAAAPGISVDTFFQTLDAAHDREALGLEASMHAASYREELLRELADSFRPGPVDVEAEDVALFAMETRARIRREVIEEVAGLLEFCGPIASGEYAGRVPADLLREFEVPHGQ